MILRYAVSYDGKMHFSIEPLAKVVTPAKAEVQKALGTLDSRLRGNDGKWKTMTLAKSSLENHIVILVCSFTKFSDSQLLRFGLISHMFALGTYIHRFMCLASNFRSLY
jgi:hypothetical protein